MDLRQESCPKRIEHGERMANQAVRQMILCGAIRVFCVHRLPASALKVFLREAAVPPRRVIWGAPGLFNARELCTTWPGRGSVSVRRLCES
jgi:hypothetical protein